MCFVFLVTYLVFCDEITELFYTPPVLEYHLVITTSRMAHEVPWEHRIVLKRSNTNSDLWFFNLSRNSSNASDNSIDDIEEHPVAVVKKCYFKHFELAYKHSEILAKIIEINTVCNENFDESPFCISSFSMQHTDDISMISYCMPRFPFSLSDYVSHKPMEDTAKIAPCILLQIAEAMEMLHDASLVHLDLKLDNILINEWPYLKASIADFDTTMFTNETDGAFHEDRNYMKQSLYHGTPAYSAPEHLQQKVCKASDVWSFGCMALILCTGLEDLWPNSSILSIFYRVVRKNQTAYENVETHVMEQAEILNDGINRQLLELIRVDLLRHDVNARLSFNVIAKKIRCMCRV
jgi:serine/threonine protein kinase